MGGRMVGHIGTGVKRHSEDRGEKGSEGMG